MSKKKVLAIVIPIVVVVVCVAVLVTLLLTLNNVYSKMNKTISSHDGELNVTVKTRSGETELVSIITVTRSGETSIINYAVQQFAEISPDNIPENAVKTISGSITANNGVVVSQTGETVEGVDFLQYATVGLNFKKAYFKNVSDEQGVFTADVTNVGAFTGNGNLKCIDMKVSFNYAAEDAKDIIVSYVSESGASVSITYTLK